MRSGEDVYLGNPSSHEGTPMEGPWARWLAYLRRVTWSWEPPLNAWVRVFCPLAALALGLLIAGLVSQAFWKMWTFLVVYHSPLGMYMGVTSGAYVGLDIRVVIFIVIMLHLFGGLFVTWNSAYLRVLPRLGPRIQRMEHKARRKYDARPRLRDLGVVGVGLFTLLPIPGSGLVSGALLGRLLGLPWFPIWVAVVLGGMTRVITVTLVVYGIWEFTPWS